MKRNEILTNYAAVGSVVELRGRLLLSRYQIQSFQFRCHLQSLYPDYCLLLVSCFGITSLCRQCFQGSLKLCKNSRGLKTSSINQHRMTISIFYAIQRLKTKMFYTTFPSETPRRTLSNIAQKTPSLQLGINQNSVKLFNNSRCWFFPT